MPLSPPEVLTDLRTSSPTSVPDTKHASSSRMSPVPIEQPAQPAFSLLHRIIKTQLNKFGLFCVYNTDSLPTHDPEDPYSVENMVLPPVALKSSRAEPSNKPSKNPYHPYPNESVMLLEDWYWNQEVQKSRRNFRQLLDIVSDPTFSSSAVLETAWGVIDEQLGWNQFNGDHPEWLGRSDGWKCSSATISVLFHSWCSHPGVQDYTIDGFYHHSLISIIKEKIANPAHAALFHFKPYELRWQPPHRDHSIKVYGELFSSTAFIEANNVLQALPGEPGCDLPHVVVVLMFWSDATKLMAFGDAKLWPLYVFFGNESKYQRSQPSNGLCSHAAYFQSVSAQFSQGTVMSIHCHSVTRQIQRFFGGAFRQQSCSWCASYPLPAGALPWTVEDTLRWRVHGGLWTWDCYILLQWC